MTNDEQPLSDERYSDSKVDAIAAAALVAIAVATVIFWVSGQG